jgi:hypothetical protein
VPYGIRPLGVRSDRISEELAVVGINAEPAVYDDDIADEAREQLRAVDACSFGSIGSIKGRPGLCSTRCCLARTVGQTHSDVIKMEVKKRGETASSIPRMTR